MSSLETVTFRDKKGMTSAVRFFVTATGTAAGDATAAEAVRTKMLPLTNAACQSWHGPSNSSPGLVVYGSAGEYDDIEDKAVFVFQDASGGLHRYSIPAPKNTIFLADQETVDFTNSDVSAYASAMAANAVARDGTVLSSTLGGYRQRRREHRKFSVITRNPTISGQGL